MSISPRLAVARITFAAIAFPLLAAGCSSEQNVPSAFAPSSVTRSLAPIQFQTARPAKHKKTYGVLLEEQLSVSSGNENYAHTYCEAKTTTSGSCPLKFGARNAKHNQSKTLSNSDGSFSGSQSGKSSLGSDTYSSDAQASSTDKSSYVEGASSIENFQWNDTLHVTSNSLPQGSPVTINVALTVNPSSSNVGCAGSDIDSGTMSWIGAGYDGQNNLSVTAGCSNYSFLYFLSNGQQGRQDQGTINTTVGSSESLYVQGYVADGACGSFGGTCNGNFTSDLAGTVTWKITGITPGASYTTASGNTYH